MPAPTGAALFSIAQADYAGSLGQGGVGYLQMLMNAVASGWATWQSGLSFGGLTVTGTGIGAWVGTGAGGSLLEGAPFALPSFVFGKNTAAQVKMTNALGTVLAQKFTAWATSYKFSAVNYIGASTATPSSPGTFTATVSSDDLLSAGSGANPTGTADAWAALLTPPEFNLNSPQAKTRDMVDAASRAIESTFQTSWLTSTTADGNTAAGVAVVTTGTGSSASNPDGKLI